MKAASIVFCLILLSIVSLPAFAQDPANGEPQQIVTQFPPLTPHQLLAKPIDWGQKSERIFRGANILMNFKLTTSWIPGQDHVGLFRFRLSALPKLPPAQARQIGEKNLDAPEALEQFVARAHTCRFGLMLNDADGFLLRSIPVSFMNVSDDGNGQIVGLMANSSDQMDADEYLRFVGTDKAKGSWQVTWNSDCALGQ
ncbi:MAG: hypothetical protein KGM96_04400 [Acidobacteriota bacterium]|nr:hypothetical protein [Acidobacteriota bacterium]